MASRIDSRDAARLAALPLDWPRDVIGGQLRRGFETVRDEPERFQRYVTAALEQPTIESTAPAGVRSIAELAVFPALAAVRIQRADPFVGTAYEEAQPVGSSERRMLRKPLWAHPGLTTFCLHTRNYYISTVLWLFREQLPEDLQSEIAARVLAPDPVEATAPDALRTYQTRSSGNVCSRYGSRTDVTEEGVWVRNDAVTRCCLVHPRAGEHFPSLYRDLPNMTVQSGRLLVPNEVFTLKLAEYSWHGWARLVNILYNELTQRDTENLTEATPFIDKSLRAPFRRRNRVYTPYYGVENVTNRRREWKEKTSGNAPKPIRIEDKRLLTATDCIRATSDLSFEEFVPVDRLFDAVCHYFPPPGRPGNDIGSWETLVAALENAVSSRTEVREHPQTGETFCKLPRPEYTPFHSERSEAPWDRYLESLARQTRSAPETRWIRPERIAQRRQIVRPYLSEEHANRRPYARSLRRSQRDVAVLPHGTAVMSEVEPLVDPASIPDLDHEELVFVTRIALAMERRLEDHSLTTSMRTLGHREDGRRLHVDEGKLRSRGWLEEHSEGPGLLYTVPRDKRKRLGVTNVSHDGYGEKTTAEKTLHRSGVDRTAAALATKDDVTRVVRYYDLWRLKSSGISELVTRNDLDSARVDVIAFDGETPKYAAGVETYSKDKSKPQSCVDKLTILSESLETWFVVPDSDHLWKIMRQLDEPDCLGLDSFPRSNSGNYSRSNWERKLRSEGVLGGAFDELHTYRSLDARTAASTDCSDQCDIVGLPPWSV